MKGGASPSSKEGRRGEESDQKGECPPRLSKIENAVVSLRTWTKLVAILLSLVTLLLAVIATLLLLQLRVDEKRRITKDAATGETADEMSSLSDTDRSKRFIDYPGPNGPILTKMDSIASVMIDGFSNLTARFDRASRLLDNLPFVNFPSSEVFQERQRSDSVASILIDGFSNLTVKFDRVSQFLEDLSVNFSSLEDFERHYRRQSDSITAILTDGFSNLTAKFDRASRFVDNLSLINFSTTEIVKQLRQDKRRSNSIISILNNGFSNLTAMLDRVSQRLDNLVSINSSTEVLERQSMESVEDLIRALVDSVNQTGADAKFQLEIIADIGQNAGATLDGMLERFTRVDYRQPNFSCPNWNRGDYQNVGPNGYYSTCYYLELNVSTRTAARSTCEGRGGKLVEIESKVELEYLRKISPRFWLGAKKDLDNGVWLWEESGIEVNFGLWTTNSNSYGKAEQSCALTAFGPSGDTFMALEDNMIGVDAICESPSKFVAENPPPTADPYPAPEWDDYESGVTNSTYLFSEFVLPWSSSQRFCEEKGGSLAEIESPLENEDLISRMNTMSGRARPSSRWLGARSRGFRWIWNRTNRSLEASYTDWKPDRGNVGDSACLSMSGRDQRGFYWEGESCLDWKLFICEIPSNDSISAPFDLNEYLGEELCQENTYRFDGFATTVKNCFRLVKLQYSHERAEAYCSDRSKASLAEIDSLQKSKLASLLGNNLGGRTQALWWMKMEPNRKITTDRSGVVFIDGRHICANQYTTNATADVICRQQGLETRSFYKTNHRIVNRNGFVNVNCVGHELSLDECRISPKSSCPSSYRHGYYRNRHQYPATLRVRCSNGTEPATSSLEPARCARTVQTHTGRNGTKTELKASSADCGNLHWFICEAKPQIIHDIQG